MSTNAQSLPVEGFETPPQLRIIEVHSASRSRRTPDFSEGVRAELSVLGWDQREQRLSRRSDSFEV